MRTQPACEQLQKKIRALENELEEKTRRLKLFKTLLDESPFSVSILDPNGRIEYANLKLLEFNNKTREEAIGAHWDRFLPETAALRNELSDIRSAVFDRREMWEKEFSETKTNGEKIWRKARLFPIRGNGGESPKLGYLSEDITEKQKADQKLRESEETYRNLFQNAQVGLYRSRIADGKMLEANQKLANMFGFENRLSFMDEFVPSEYWINPEERKRIIREAEKKGGKTSFEIPFYRKDRSTFWTRFSVCIYPEKGWWEGIAEDITEQKQAQNDSKKLESQLIQAQKMQSIGTLASGIAHDFNNILAAIIGCTELSLLDVAEEDTIHPHLNEVLRASLRAKELVKQILVFSRQADQEKKPLDPALILKESIKMLKASLPSNIKIDQRIEGDVGYVSADPTQIHQVMMNLCTNAAHAMREKGGHLVVSLFAETIDAAQQNGLVGLTPGKYLCISVSDTGHGIPKGVMEQIFDPYYTTKGVGEGTGLGLSVVHGIVKSHGGSITVDSEVGKGTTFQLYFPKLQNSGMHEIYDDHEPLPTGQGCILLVDDESSLVSTGKEMLEKLGYAVTASTNCFEILDELRQHPEAFDLLITDHTMPDMTGTDLAREVLKIRPDLPIIMCTGFSNVITEETAKAIGIRKIVMKPVVMRDMAEAIKEVL